MIALWLLGTVIAGVRYSAGRATTGVFVCEDRSADSTVPSVDVRPPPELASPADRPGEPFRVTRDDEPAEPSAGSSVPTPPVVDSGVDAAGRGSEPAADASSEGAIVSRLEATHLSNPGFDYGTVDDVVAALRSATGLPFEVTPRARAPEHDGSITWGRPGAVTARQVLDDAVSECLGLGWDVRAGVVRIATKEEIELRWKRLKYFDVRSIVSRTVIVRGADGQWEDREVPEPLLSPDALVETIRAEVDPETWSDENASVAVKNGTLIVKNGRDTIERVEQLVEGLRETRVRWASENTPPGPPPGPPPARPTLWNRFWPVEDLVGLGSGDGTTEASDGSATAPAYAPGALVALLRVSVESDLTEHPEASIALDQGTLRLHLNGSAIVRVERLLRELRARTARPAPRDEPEHETMPALPKFILNPR